MSPRQLVAVVAALRHNGALARIELGFLVATTVEWAGWLALVVIAFERGGAAEAGLTGFALAVPAIVVAPTAAILGDRWPRSRVLLGSYLAQAAAFVGAGLAFLAGATLLGYALGITAMTLVALVRQLIGSLLPEVSRSPEELTAGNVASGLAEGSGTLFGPLVAGFVFAIAGAPIVLVLGAGGMVLAAALLLPLAVDVRAIPRDRLRSADANLADALQAVGRELSGGAAAVLADRRLSVLNGLIAATIGVLGALNVLIVVVAIDVLGLGSDAAGFLMAAEGLGALVGGAMASALVGREKLVGPLLLSVIVFATATVATGLVTTPLPVIVALAGTGIGWSIAYIAAVTLTQRLAGDNVMTRVFGVSESIQTGSEALGGLAVPLLVAVAGPGGALVALGAGLVGVAAITAPTLLRTDRVDPAFLRDVAVIRAVLMCSPLSGPVLERLAVGAERQTVAEGTEIVRQGDSGDRFYVVASGGVRVTVSGRDAGELGPGSSFGEIALLRDVPRTASVWATEPTELLAIQREPFLEALTGQPRSRVMAGDVIEQRLASDAASTDG